MPLGPLSDSKVDAEMSADWRDILSRHSEDDDTPETPEGAPEAHAEGQAPPAESPSEEEVETPPATAEERARDESGRFKKAPKTAKPDKVAPAQEAQQPSDEQQEVQPQQQQEAARDIARAPSTWRPTARAEWAKLPESVRAEIHRRESDFMTGQHQLLPDARFGQNMRGVVEPFRMLIESEGATPELAVQDLLRTAAILRTGTVQQKYQTVANIAQRFGVNLAAFVPRQGQPGPTLPQSQEYRDPRVDTLLQQMQTQEQQRAQREQRDAETLVSSWMNEADAQGQPLRPYVTDLINDMSLMIPQIKAANPHFSHTQALEAAYERASWANPEIRALLQQQQQTATDAQRRAENQQRTSVARRAASVNVPRRASTPAPAKPGSMDETLAATARELGLL